MNSERFLLGRRTGLVWAALLAAASALIACEVTSEKIQNWKLSEKGSAKIRYALRDTRQKLPIRAEAAEALGDLGLYAPLSEDLKTLSAEDRKPIVDELEKRVVARMRGSNPTATSKVQIQAKDTLFSIRDFVDEGQRRSIDDEVVRWVLADWANRKEGENSAEKIIRTVGKRAGPHLAEQVAADPQNLLTLTTLLREVGDPAARDAGAEKLMALAKQQKPIEEVTLAGLGKVGSIKALGFLEGLVKSGEPEQRVKALQAMAGFPDKSSVAMAKALASDKNVAAELRDEAFTLLEKINDPSALEALLGFVAAKEDKVRYRAVEAVLEGFGPAGLAKLLEGLPQGYTYKKVDLKDLVEDDIVKLGTKALPPLRSALSSKSWIARLVAVHTLGRLGTGEDIPALEKLGGDGTKLKGWDGGATIGTEAKAAIEQIRGRR
jgi:HEAT repeat protein